MIWWKEPSNRSRAGGHIAVIDPLVLVRVANVHDSVADIVVLLACTIVSHTKPTAPVRYRHSQPYTGARCCKLACQQELHVLNSCCTAVVCSLQATSWRDMHLAFDGISRCVCCELLRHNCSCS